MQVTINIDASQVGDTMVDVMKSLTAEQKNDLAYKALKSWLDEPIQLPEVNVIEKAALEHVKTLGKEIYVSKDKEGKNTYSRIYKYPSECTDEQLKTSGEFKDFVKTYKTTKQQLILSIAEEIKNYYLHEVGKAVQADPQLIEVKDKIFKTVQDNYPKAVLSSVMMFMSNHLNSLSDCVRDIAERQVSADGHIQALEQRILTNN
jgi:hypothetical protein